MGFDAGMQYRGRAVVGQGQIATNTNGTEAAEVMIEVTQGPMVGQRIRYRGYINTPKNMETTAEELRAMGCKLSRWGDWTGLGSKEFVFTCLVDEAGNKRYIRAAFVRALAQVNAERAISASDLDRLNRDLPPPPPAANGAARLVPTPATDEDLRFADLP